jgi:hypothetical protein
MKQLLIKNTTDKNLKVTLLDAAISIGKTKFGIPDGLKVTASGYGNNIKSFEFDPLKDLTAESGASYRMFLLSVIQNQIDCVGILLESDVQNQVFQNIKYFREGDDPDGMSPLFVTTATWLSAFDLPRDTELDMLPYRVFVSPYKIIIDQFVPIQLTILAHATLSLTFVE